MSTMSARDKTISFELFSFQDQTPVFYLTDEQILTILNSKVSPLLVLQAHLTQRSSVVFRLSVASESDVRRQNDPPLSAAALF